MKKICLISPTPTHPTSAGNRARLLNLIEHLKVTYEVHFIHVLHEPGDERLMRRFWGDKVMFVKYQNPYYRNVQNNLLRRIKNKLNNTFLYTRIFPPFLLDARMKIDDWYDEGINSQVIDYVQAQHFDAVIVLYVFMSKIFDYLPPGIVKILDSQDVMSHRHTKLSKSGMKAQWFSTIPREEKKGVSRADIIMAIQEEEKNHFQKISNKQIITVGHPVQLKSNESPELGKRLLFVGSENEINVSGIKRFIEEIFPKLKKIFPEIVLNIAGNVCHKLGEYDYCVKLGFIENLEEMYNEGDIVIVPIWTGTGLKIKAIEAMGFSKPMVVTTAGAAGLPGIPNESYCLGKTNDEFASKIELLLTDIKFRNTVGKNAYQTAVEYNKSVFKDLDKALNNALSNSL